MSLSDKQADACLELAEIRTTDLSFVDRVRALEFRRAAETGLSELAAVVAAGAEYAPGFLAADLKIARGLDYYTGTVYETVMEGHEDLGSVCSGGRTTRWPATGRPPIRATAVHRVSASSAGCSAAAYSPRPGPYPPACWWRCRRRRPPAGRRVAAALRARGIAAESRRAAAKFGRQIRYAERRGIPYVWFPGRDGSADQVKDIRSGDQTDATAADWTPAATTTCTRASSECNETARKRTIWAVSLHSAGAKKTGVHCIRVRPPWSLPVT